MSIDLNRRRFLKHGMDSLRICGVGAVWANLLTACSYLSSDSPATLLAADENGVRLPAGLHSRIVARSGQAVIDKDYVWHAAPDGGACFATDEGGWIYVSNSEKRHIGGVGAIVFDSDGSIVDAYPVLEGTERNCAGGATPWGSWLSCEEVQHGRVWECFPDGKSPAILRPALGTFRHEAVAVDERSGMLYLTEDQQDGCLYRFRAGSTDRRGYPDLSSGELQVAVSKQSLASEKQASGAKPVMVLDWETVSDPLASQQPTRRQVPAAFRFDGGEGIAWSEGGIVFVTKGDNRVWSYDTVSQHLSVLYDARDSITPILTGVDNVTVSPDGEIYVAEDGGNQQIVALNQRGELYPVLQLQGHEASEITGPAFSPDGKRLYFSSQRGVSGRPEDGVTFEISGF